MKSVGYALLLAAVFCSQATAVEVNEAVLEEGASGTAVVLLSVAHIQQAAIFPDGNQLLRRIAYVETRDGTDSENEGGIWAVSEAAFDSTKDTSDPLLATKHEQILQEFSIVWQSVQLSDLRRPLYSALAARLVLFIAPQAIPSDTDVTGQAQFWRENYNTDGSVDEFIGAARELQGNFDVLENSGSDFYVGFARNGGPNLQLLITTREADPVTFTVDTLLGFSFTGVATRNSTTVVPLNSSFQVASSDERNKGIHVSAGDKTIIVNGLDFTLGSSDAFLALPYSRQPVDQYEYYAITYHGTLFLGDEILESFSQLLFVGNEDNTIVTFNASTIITLNKMETYLYQMALETTGTRVTSNKPISVFSGHQCTFVPETHGGCDLLSEQIPHTATWGTTFLSASFESRMSGEIYRILASQPSTTVSVSCTGTQSETYSLATAGAWQEFMTPDDSFCAIESNKPLLVVEFALGQDLDDGEGGPFMMMIPPVEQYSNNYVINIPSQFPTNFITIFVPPEYFEPEKIFVDDISQEQADWTPKGCPGSDRVCGYAAHVSLEAGAHRLYHSDTLAKIGVSVYGFSLGSSYGYPGGLQLVPLQLAIVSFSQETYFVGENETTLKVSVVRSGNAESQVVVLVANDPNEGSATAGQDYTTVSEILEFSPGDTEKELEIKILDDIFGETSETFVLYLSSGVGVYLSPIAQTEVTIIDNEVPCDPPCENGVCLANNTCDCSEGYSGDTCADKIESDAGDATIASAVSIAAALVVLLIIN